MDIQPYINQMLGYIEAQDYAGYDPYDALKSPLLKALSRKSKWARILFTQFLKRSSLNVRPVVGIKKGHNPKGIGLFLWGYSKLYKIEQNPQYLSRIEHLLKLLEKLRCDGYSGSCWGYNFDWQSRTYFRPEGTPTIVNTSFIGHALLDCFEYTGIRRALDMAVSIKDFILRDLYRTKECNAFCFSYTPIDKAVVHNANLLGASLLIRLHKICGDAQTQQAALNSLAYSMRYQQENGAWYYGETEKQRWIDSFHTGFNLQAIRYFLQAGFGEEYNQAYEKGVEFYADRFFLADGKPKYYADKVYPIDIHCPAQAIVFFSSMGEKYGELTERILKWMLKNLYNDKGYFYFQKSEYHINTIPYIRWGQAWCFHGLTEYLLTRGRSEDARESELSINKDFVGSCKCS